MAYREHITRENIAADLRDLPHSMNWELLVTRWPEAVYYPGALVFKTRLLAVTPPSSISHSTQTVNMHGHTFNMPGSIDRSGDVSLEFQDTTDRSISHAFIDWMNKIEDPSTKLGLPKADVTADMTLIMMDNALNPIIQYKMSTMMPTNYDSQDRASGSKDPLGNITVNLSIEHVVPTVLTQ